MSRRYDTRTTVFSPEGRLYQVEYAMEAISHAGTCLGILCKDGIVLAAENKNTSKLLESSIHSEKIYKMNDDIACNVAGITADANILINYARQQCQRYKMTYQENIPCEQLVQQLCDLKQAYTQYGGQRPFGVSLLYAGWDEHFGFQLYQSDPSGNYGGWKATCVGSNGQAVQGILKQEHKDEMTIEETLQLASRVLTKVMDNNTLSSEKLEFAVLSRDKDKNKTVFKIIEKEKTNQLLKEAKETLEQEKEEKKAKK